jgi:polyisoprenyl-teichoic acid--peptidoglycan teichoic acid transferase
MKHKIKGYSKKSILIRVLISLAIVLILITAFVIYKFYKYKSYDDETMFTERDSQLPVSIPSKEAAAAQEPLGYGLELSEGEILYDDDIYMYNEAIINILLIGIDTYEKGVTVQDGVNTGGQADTIMVLTINTKTNEFVIIRIPRDTMAEVVMLDSDYNYAATISAPICTAHSYGDGETLSNELMMRAVSRLLYDIPIYRYYSLNLEAIADIVDELGGITLEMLDDFTNIDPGMEKGKTATLNGSRAIRYIKYRGGGDDYSNRMPRQLQFMYELYRVIKGRTKENFTFPLTLMETVKGNTVNNLSISEVTYLTSLMLEHDLNARKIITIPGEMGEKFYLTDDEELHKIIVETFYILKDDNTQ